MVNAGFVGRNRQAIDAHIEEMRRVCQQHDYDLKFRSVLEAVEDSVPPDRQDPETRWDTALAGVLGPAWRQLVAGEWRGSRTVVARLRAMPVWVVSKLAQQGPDLNVVARLARAPQSAATKGIATLRLVMADGGIRRLPRPAGVGGWSR